MTIAPEPPPPGAPARPAGARAPVRRAPASERAVATGLAAGCFAVLGVAAWLDPPGAGHGAHTQLGLPPCTWAIALERPCPTCGMTTAFARAADGDLAGAFIAQPFGALLSIATATVFWGALHVALTGSRLGRLAGLAIQPRAMLAAGVLALGAWVYKLTTWGG